MKRAVERAREWVKRTRLKLLFATTTYRIWPFNSWHAGQADSRISNAINANMTKRCCFIALPLTIVRPKVRAQEGATSARLLQRVVGWYRDALFSQKYGFHIPLGDFAFLEEINDQLINGTII